MLLPHYLDSKITFSNIYVWSTLTKWATESFICSQLTYVNIQIEWALQATHKCSHLVFWFTCLYYHRKTSFLNLPICKAHIFINKTSVCIKTEVVVAVFQLTMNFSEIQFFRPVVKYVKAWRRFHTFAKNLIFRSPRCNSTASDIKKLITYIFCRFSKGILRRLLIRTNYHKVLTLQRKKICQNNTGYCFLFFYSVVEKYCFLFSLQKGEDKFSNITHADPQISTFSFYFFPYVKMKREL